MELNVPPHPPPPPPPPLLMLTYRLIWRFIDILLGDLSICLTLAQKKKQNAVPPVRVHLFPRRRRSTFLLYLPLYALRHCRRGQDGGKITSADASRMMLLEPSSSQVA